MKTKYFFILFLLLFVKPLFAQDQFVGEVRLFANNFAPNGWLECDGRLLPIQNYTALFSILGTTYGGNGKTNFALPDLRNRMAVGAGAGPSLQPVDLGQMDGQSSVTLTTNNLPPHTHSVEIKVSSAAGTSSVPALNSSLATPVQNFNNTTRSVTEYNSTTPDVTLPKITTTTTGNYTPYPIPVGQPILSSNYYIAIQGIFPPRW